MKQAAIVFSSIAILLSLLVGYRVMDVIDALYASKEFGGYWEPKSEDHQRVSKNNFKNWYGGAGADADYWTIVASDELFGGEAWYQKYHHRFWSRAYRFPLRVDKICDTLYLYTFSIPDSVWHPGLLRTKP